MRIVFMGTPEFAVPSLLSVHKIAEVVAVYCQPPKPAGRGQSIQKSAVHCAAEACGLQVITPKSLRTPESQDTLRQLRPDAIIVAAYGLLLPQTVLDIPKYGCWNVHASLLPRWRGAAPIQHAILAGDTETGITIMRMEAGLDTGPMLIKKRTPLTNSTTATELHDILSLMGAKLVSEAIPLLHSQPTPTPQPEVGVTYAPKLTKADGQLDWRKPATELERQIRALNPWPGTWFTQNGTVIKLRDARVISWNNTAQPGLILNDQAVIACGQDALQLLTLQRPGGKWLPVDEFLRGYSLPKGVYLDCIPN
jgi:methionyl-tRNA formyltransferase